MTALWLALTSGLWNQNWGQTHWKPGVSLSFLSAKLSLLNAELKTDWRLLAALGISWLADRGGSPASFLSLPAKVSGLDADALHRLPSSCTKLGVNETKLKVSTMWMWSEVALYSWGWSDGHQTGEETGWSPAVLAEQRAPRYRTAVWKVVQSSFSATSTSVIPGNLRMIKILFKHWAKFWAQFYRIHPERLLKPVELLLLNISINLAQCNLAKLAEIMAKYVKEKWFEPLSSSFQRFAFSLLAPAFHLIMPGSKMHSQWQAKILSNCKEGRISCSDIHIS